MPVQCIVWPLKFPPIYVSKRANLKVKIISHRKAFCSGQCIATKKQGCKCMSESPIIETNSQK